MSDELQAQVLVDELRRRSADGPPDWLGSVLESTPDSLRSSPDLAYLHQHWSLHETVRPTSLRAALRSPTGAVRALVRRAVLSTLEPYFKEEQELLTHTIRLLDTTAKRCDALQEDLLAAIAALRHERGGGSIQGEHGMAEPGRRAH